MINFNSNINLNSIAPYSPSNKGKNVMSPMLKQLTNDVFVRSANVEKTHEKKFDEKRIREIYEKTYLNVLKENPITKELNMEKPTITFEYDNSSAGASYRFASNNIVFKKDFNQNTYICISKENNKMTDARLANEDELDEIQKNKGTQEEIEIKKLTDDEKELFLSSMLAHELRHAIQSHIVASTEGVCEKQRKLDEETQVELQEYLNSLEKTKEELGKEGLLSETDFEELKEIDETIEDTKKEINSFEYEKKYKPKKLFPKDMQLKFSAFENDNRYWSINDLLRIPNDKDLTEEEKREAYYAQPVEIDAYNYQFEYLARHKKEYKNINKDVVDAYMLTSLVNSDRGIELAEKYGYSKPQEK